MPTYSIGVRQKKGLHRRDMVFRRLILLTIIVTFSVILSLQLKDFASSDGSQSAELDAVVQERAPVAPPVLLSVPTAKTVNTAPQSGDRFEPLFDFDGRGGKDWGAIEDESLNHGIKIHRSKENPGNRAYFLQGINSNQNTWIGAVFGPSFTKQERTWSSKTVDALQLDVYVKRDDLLFLVLLLEDDGGAFFVRSDWSSRPVKADQWQTLVFPLSQFAVAQWEHGSKDMLLNVEAVHTVKIVLADKEGNPPVDRLLIFDNIGFQVR